VCCHFVVRSAVEDALSVTDMLSDDDDKDSSPVCCCSSSVEGWSSASAFELSEDLPDDDVLVAVATATAAAAAPAWLLHVDDVSSERNPLLRGDCMWCDAELFQKLLTMSSSSSSSSKTSEDDIDRATTLSTSGPPVTNRCSGRSDDEASPLSPVDRCADSDNGNYNEGTFTSVAKSVAGVNARRWLGKHDVVNMGIEHVMSCVLVSVNLF
jgi:hypothetical protein